MDACSGVQRYNGSASPGGEEESREPERKRHGETKKARGDSKSQRDELPGMRRSTEVRRS